MAKLPVRITDRTNQANTSGGVAHRSIAHFDEIAVIGSTVAAANVSGGVVPLGADEYAAMMISAIGQQPAAWFRADTGVTVTGLGASMVADQADSDNALVLPGVASNSASTGDSAPISFTGSIDIQVYASLSDWTPTAINVLLEKANAGATTSYLLYVTNTTGVLTYSYYNATTLAVINSASTAAPTVTDGGSLWVRVTHNTTTGDVTFYTGGSGSTPTWSQLGNVVSTSAGLRNDTAGSLAVGARPFDGSLPLSGKIYRAIVKSGIDGTTVFDANFAAQTKGTTSFSESSSNAATVTVNQSGALPAHIGSQKDLLQGTDASRPPYLSYSGTRYLYLPGVAGNWASTPDSVPASITGDIDIRVRVAMDDWTPAAVSTFVAKYSGTPNNSYWFYMQASGIPVLAWTADGTTAISKPATAAPTVSDGAAIWIRVTLDVDNGSAQNDVKFYTAADSATEPTSWTQLGATVTTAGTTSIYDGNSVVGVGQTGGGSFQLAGDFYRAIIKNGIDGTTVVDFNPNLDGSDQAATITSSATGEVWTINSSGGLPAQIVGRPSLLFDGSADYLRCADFSLPQPISIYAALKQVSWTSADYFWDGASSGDMALQQTNAGASPQIRALGAGGAKSTSSVSALAVGAYGVVCVVYNSTSSVIQVNNSATTGQDLGAAAGGGFILGANDTAAALANQQVLEVIIFSTAHDATQRARIIAYLAGRHGVSL